LSQEVDALLDEYFKVDNNKVKKMVFLVKQKMSDYLLDMEDLVCFFDQNVKNFDKDFII
jgi:hypothetical protein